MPVGEGDAAYCYALLVHALPIIEEFKPDVIFVACGLDAMAGDPCVSFLLLFLFFCSCSFVLRSSSQLLCCGVCVQIS
jgi:acetoin utilization deacetylase AcuC-like enzyme